jgi:glycosyltransferase involved in cell wall biosynthesis
MNGSSIVGDVVKNACQKEHLEAIYIEIPQGRRIVGLLKVSEWIFFKFLKRSKELSNDFIVYWPITLMGIMYWRDLFLCVSLKVLYPKIRIVSHYHNYFRRSDYLSRIKKMLWVKVVSKDVHVFLSEMDASNWNFNNFRIVKNFARNDFSVGSRNRNTVRRVGAIFNVEDFKRFDIFMELAKSFPAIKFEHCGRYEKITADPVLPVNLKLNGVLNTSEINDFLSSVDLLIHPSEMERMPLVILEALNAGVPVIARDIGLIREYCEGNNICLLKRKATLEDFEVALKYRIGNNQFIYSTEYNKSEFEDKIMKLLKEQDSLY